MNPIEMRNVFFRYGKREVLHGLNLTVEAGETLAFLGRNGSGKTTAIQLMMGLLKPASGDIRLLDMSPIESPLEVKSAVGYLAEDQQMFGWMRIGQLIQFVASFYPTWDMQFANKLLGDFQLTPDQRVKHLSKGQNVRLGLLLAIAHRPKLIILDDPALGLDPIMRQDLNRDLITYLHSEGTTVLYSSHLLYEVEAVADRVAILDNGVIIKQAPTEKLRAEVKQLQMSGSAYARCREELHVLDLQRSGNDVAVIIEQAADTLPKLTHAELSFEVGELNLDEIFAAYVNGRQDTSDAKTELTPA